MTLVIQSGCTCERSYDGFICKMHYKAAKGIYYDEVAYHESYERIQGNRKRRYGIYPKSNAGKRQTVGLLRTASPKTQQEL